MLRNAGLNAEPVVLATRSEEHLDPILPNPSAINYVIGIIKIDDKDYFLDASDKYMPFGILPAECYNGYCRVISKTPAAVDLHSNNLKDKNVTIVSLLPDKQAKDKLILKVDRKFGDVTASGLRNRYNGDSSKLKEQILSGLSKLSIPATLTRYSYSSLTDADEALTIHYEASLNWDRERI